MLLLYTLSASSALTGKVTACTDPRVLSSLFKNLELFKKTQQTRLRCITKPASSLRATPTNFNALEERVQTQFLHQMHTEPTNSVIISHTVTSIPEMLCPPTCLSVAMPLPAEPGRCVQCCVLHGCTPRAWVSKLFHTNLCKFLLGLFARCCFYLFCPYTLQLLSTFVISWLFSSPFLKYLFSLS